MPIPLQDMLKEELQAIAVDLDRRPAISLDQGIEVTLQLLLVQYIDRTVKELAQSSNGAGIGIDAGIGFALALQCVNMFTIL